MQLSGVTAFLLFILQYGVSLCHKGHFDEELRNFQASLIKRIYEDAALDPKEDNEEIETIAKAILDEADRRLKKREQVKDHKYLDKDANDYNNNVRDSRIHNDVYKYIASDVFRDLLKLHDVYMPKSTGNDVVDDVDNNGGYNHDTGQHKRDIDDTQIEDFIDKRYKKEIGENEVAQHSISQQKVRSSRKADVEDNVQVASVDVDNTPDFQTRLANNARHLFLEPNSYVSKEENNTSYEQHRLKVIVPPKKIVTNKVDRTGLDQLSFIAVVVACCVAGIAGIGLASFCWYKLRSETKEFKSSSSDFKSGSLRSSGSGGYGKKTTEEDKLARGAEVFHYLHAKKQIQQMEEPSMKSSDRGVSINESTDDEEEEEDTVYECPGLAPPGDMKVVNPLFSDNESHYSDTPSVQSTPTPPLEDK